MRTRLRQASWARASRWLFPCVVSVACGGQSSSPREESNAADGVASVSARLEGARPDPDARWVVAVLNERFRAVCTGALISPNLVLTTRHCLDLEAGRNIACDERLSSPAAAEDLIVSACADVQQLGAAPTCAWHRAAELVRPAESAFCGSDIALLVLAAPIPGVEARPATPVLDAASLRRISTFSVVGFGSTSPKGEQWGIRRRLDELPLSCLQDEAECSPFIFDTPVDPREFVSVGTGVCEGDSGAPATVLGADGGDLVVGLVSRGGVSGGKCVGSVYTRTDAWADWLRKGARLAAIRGRTSVAPWAALSDGEACSDSVECSSGTCAGSAGSRTCASACRCPGGDCAEQTCARTATGNGCSSAVRPANATPSAVTFGMLALFVAGRRRRR